MIRFFVNGNALVKGIMGAIVTFVVCYMMSTEVLPAIINGSDGGMGQTVLPIFQSALLIGGIMAAIGVLYVVTSGTFGGKGNK